MIKYFVLLVILLLAIPSIAAQTSPWCGINNLYFQDRPSGIDGFRDLANYASGDPQSDENVTINATSGIVPIDAYISKSGTPGSNVTLQMGLRQYNIYGYASSVSQPSYFAINVSKYNTQTGKETFFYNISSIAISSVTPTLDRTVYVSQSQTTFTSDERLLIRIGAYTTRVTPTTIHFLNQGTSAPTYVQSGYFDCSDIDAEEDYTEEAAAAALGLIGGSMGGVLFIKKRREK